MEKYLGTWRLESSEKFDEYMKVIGVGFVLRKAGNTIKPDVQFVANEDGSYTLKTISTFKSGEVSFKLGEQFEETTIDGRKVQSTVSLEEDGSLKHEQASTPPSTIVRNIDESGHLVVTIKAADVVCTRKYKKL